jgi:hypothetical protein
MISFSHGIPVFTMTAESMATAAAVTAAVEVAAARIPSAVWLRRVCQQLLRDPGQADLEASALRRAPDAPSCMPTICMPRMQGLTMNPRTCDHTHANSSACG